MTEVQRHRTEMEYGKRYLIRLGNGDIAKIEAVFVRYSEDHWTWNGLSYFVDSVINNAYISGFKELPDCPAHNPFYV